MDTRWRIVTDALIDKGADPDILRGLVAKHQNTIGRFGVRAIHRGIAPPQRNTNTVGIEQVALIRVHVGKVGCNRAGVEYVTQLMCGLQQSYLGISSRWTGRKQNIVTDQDRCPSGTDISNRTICIDLLNIPNCINRECAACVADVKPGSKPTAAG